MMLEQGNAHGWQATEEADDGAAVDRKGSAADMTGLRVLRRGASVRSAPAQIQGPAGEIEALVDTIDDEVLAVAVVCHPHPLHGGTMRNKVTQTLSYGFARLGAASARFNFRGVGRSAGTHGGGPAERDDLAAVVAWSRAQWPAKDLYLGGFSFGAGVAMSAAHACQTSALVTVAPPVARFEGPFSHPGCPWLLIQGADDDIVLPSDVTGWAAKLAPSPEIVVVPDTGHFFHGRLGVLTDAVATFFAELTDPYAHGASRRC
jgi:uncharacterized protein